MNTHIPAVVLDKARSVSLLVLDVDGVLTDGALYYGNNGEELKAFSILDGLGIKLLRDSGVQVAIITGRRSELVLRRATELGIERVQQGREDKHAALTELCATLELKLSQVAYMGDDLPDLGAIRRAGLGITVANAPPFVAKHADWQTAASGGNGAVREACEMIMHAQGTLTDTLERYL